MPGGLTIIGTLRQPGDGVMVASHCKSVAKAITWRVLGAADTFVLSFLVTGKATAAVGIVGLGYAGLPLAMVFAEAGTIA